MKMFKKKCSFIYLKNHMNDTMQVKQVRPYNFIMLNPNTKKLQF